jgi:hypothetical protein
MSALTQRYAPQNWRDNLISGGAILVLHWLLVNCFPLQKPTTSNPDNGGAAGGAAGDYLRLGGRSIPKHPL